jgi:hypothetical protein
MQCDQYKLKDQWLKIQAEEPMAGNWTRNENGYPPNFETN